MLYTLPRLGRPVVVLDHPEACLVDGLPWPTGAPPLAAARRRWPRHLHGALAAAVAHIGAGVRPARTGPALRWLDHARGPTAPGWWIVDAGAHGYDALWADLVCLDGVVQLGWWWASTPARLLADGAWWPETAWTPGWRAVPLEVACGGLGVRARGLTAARAVLRLLDERELGVSREVPLEERQVIGGEQLAAVEQVAALGVFDGIGDGIPVGLGG